eukprot:1184067-Prorocentrum_minimum.AAC.2
MQQHYPVHPIKGNEAPTDRKLVLRLQGEDPAPPPCPENPPVLSQDLVVGFPFLAVINTPIRHGARRTVIELRAIGPRAPPIDSHTARITVGRVPLCIRRESPRRGKKLSGVPFSLGAGYAAFAGSGPREGPHPAGGYLYKHSPSRALSMFLVKTREISRELRPMSLKSDSGGGTPSIPPLDPL